MPLYLREGFYSRSKGIKKEVKEPVAPLTRGLPAAVGLFGFKVDHGDGTGEESNSPLLLSFSHSRQTGKARKDFKRPNYCQSQEKFCGKWGSPLFGVLQIADQETGRGKRY
jgi:hypothetical protein